MFGRKSKGTILLGGIMCVFLVAGSFVYHKNANNKHAQCLVGIPVTNRDATHATAVVEAAVLAAERSGVSLDFAIAHRASDTLVEQAYVAALDGHGSGRLHSIVVSEYDAFDGTSGIETQLQTRLGEIRNQLLDAAQRQGYTCFLSLDADVLLQPETLQLMLGSGQEVVTALYPARWLRPDAGSVISMIRDPREMAGLVARVQGTSASEPLGIMAAAPCGFLEVMHVGLHTAFDLGVL